MLFILIASVLLIDSVSKFLIQHFLPPNVWTAFWYPYGGIGVFKNFFGIEFSIVHATNKGAAWGMLADFQSELLIFRLILIVGLIVYAFRFNKNKMLEIPLAMIIAGATGNVLDYFFYGHVVDMFHFVLWGYDFPVFNVADISIFLGVASLFCISFFEKKACKHKA